MLLIAVIKRVSSVVVALAVLLAWCGPVEAGSFPLNICGSNARVLGDGLSSTASAGFVATAECPYNGPGLELFARQGSTVGYNASAGFKVTAPAGIVINGVHVVHAYSRGIGKNGWWGEFYWNSGPGSSGRTGPLSDDQFNSGGCCSQTGMDTQSIGWFIACNQPSCTAGPGGVERGMSELQLTADEERAPMIIASGADNLWYQTGWVRGSWPAGISASDPSGVCGAFVSFGSIPTPFSGAPEIPNRHTFKQCGDQNFSATVDTRASQGDQGLGEGAMTLRFTATNAAGVTAAPAKTVYVDNSTPTVTLSGPTNAASTAGTQYVAATAAGGPSGINGISCSTDGGSSQYFPGASTLVPVSGVGQHTINCSAANNAVDSTGNRAWSSPVSWALKIGRPTVLGVSFDRIVNGLRCGRVRERISSAGRWVTIHRHGRPVWVFVHRRTRVVTITRCHLRTVRRRITVLVPVRRHGHLVRVKRTRFVRVVLPPHVTRDRVKRVSYGHRATVSGWLGTYEGAPLPGHAVLVLTAPDDGQHHFTSVGLALTKADGSWAMRIPPGPSRVVEAAYLGDPSTEPTLSAPVRVLVPAIIQIHSSSTTVPWGGRIRISGRVLGGHIPPASNILKLLFGDGPKPHTIGTPEIAEDGRFSIPISWSAGRGVVRYWFAVATLAERDYPYARGTSRRVSVIVSPRTPPRR